MNANDKYDCIFFCVPSGGQTWLFSGKKTYVWLMFPAINLHSYF